MAETASGQAGRGKRVAICVGVNNYWLENAPLNHAESDCHKLAKSLCQPHFGFTSENIHVIVNSESQPRNRPIRNNLLYRLFKLFRDEPLDLLVFYFAGHGIAVGESTYLVPADGLATIPDTCISLSALLQQIDDIPAHHRLMIFDICHGGGVRELEQDEMELLDLRRHAAGLGESGEGDFGSGYANAE